MSRKPFNPSEAGDTGSERDRNRSMVDVLALPDSEQELVTWMMRQREVSLAEAVAHMNQEEEAIAKMLNSLSSQGFVQELNVDGELRYRTYLAPKKSARTAQKLLQDLDF